MKGFPIYIRKANLVTVIMVLFWAIFVTNSVLFARTSKKADKDVNAWVAQLKKSANHSGILVIRGGTLRKTHYRKSRRSHRSHYRTYNNSGIFSAYGKATRISVNFYKADLHNVFRLIGQVSGKNIVVDEGVKGTITLSMKNVPWPFVLQVIENLKNLKHIERYNTLLIYPKKKSIEWNAGGVPGATGELMLAGINPMGARRLTIVSRGQHSIPLPKHSTEAFALIAEAYKAEQNGNFKRARLLYSRAFNLWPQNNLLAEKIAAISLGKLQDNIYALKYAKKALEANPYDAKASAYAAVALARMGKTDEARVYFEKALLGRNTPPFVYYNYAVFCEKQGNYREALRLLQHYEDTAGPSVSTYLIRARIYRHLGRKQDAINEYKAVLQSGPDVSSDLKEYAKEQLSLLEKKGKKKVKKVLTKKSATQSSNAQGLNNAKDKPATASEKGVK